MLWTLNAIYLVLTLLAAIVFLASALDSTDSLGVRILSGVMALILPALAIMRLILAVRKFLK